VNVIFPDSPAISFDYVKRPTFNTMIKRAAGRQEYRATYWPSSPLWEIQFPYKSLSAEDVMILGGFMALVRGALHDFYFKDRLHRVVGQELGTGDGAQTDFQLSRVWNWWYTEYPQFPPFAAGYGEGGQDYGGEGAGVPIWETPYLYLDGVEVNAGYAISQSGLVTFETPPAAGVAVTADFDFFYKCRFKEDYAALSLFAPKAWNIDAICLVTVE
jgi:hypothetical protein